MDQRRIRRGLVQRPVRQPPPVLARRYLDGVSQQVLAADVVLAQFGAKQTRKISADSTRPW